jgi:hypothetical protein
MRLMILMPAEGTWRAAEEGSREGLQFDRKLRIAAGLRLRR